jgi:hypothetical protein
LFVTDSSVTQIASERQALTAFEQEELEDCERVVAYGVSMFMAACRALRTIREKRLYRADFATWDAYIKARWSALFETATSANRWIAAADVQDELTPIGVTVKRESHAREITKHARDIQAAVALVGVRAAELENRAPTASHFRHAGAVIAEMVATQAVDTGDGAQHPITETLAVSVVERRRESLLQHVEANRRKPLLEATGRVIGAEGQYLAFTLEPDADLSGLAESIRRGRFVRLVVSEVLE